jgi:hypothetical protein
MQYFKNASVVLILEQSGLISDESTQVTNASTFLAISVSSLQQQLYIFKIMRKARVVGRQKKANSEAMWFRSKSVIVGLHRERHFTLIARDKFWKVIFLEQPLPLIFHES